jgi:polysaccharide export outer membrane protein
MTSLRFAGLLRSLFAPSERRLNWLLVPFLGVWVVGCAGHGKLPGPTAEDAQPFAGSAIQVGDVLKVSFPGAPNLNLAQQVRVDGRLSLGAMGEMTVTGKTPKELEEELLKLYETELIVKEISVIVESAGFPVFVAGAVLRPGRFVVNRSVTVVEAIMEAGGPDPSRANMRKVLVIRQDGGTQKTLKLDVEQSFQSPTSAPFYLRPSDVVRVPERFVFF